MSEWQTFSSREALDSALARHIARLLSDAVVDRGRASLAVSGGGTPKGMFAQLAAADIAWEHVWLTLVDERWVTADDPDSNERLVREHLLQGPAASAHFVGLKTPASKPADGLAATTIAFGTVPQPLDCVVLGMGGDGHTASWFPQAENLRELLDPGNPAPLGICDPVTAPHLRVTLTLPVVLQSSEIILHMTGEEKRAVLADAARREYPVAAITEQQANPATIWWAP